MVMTMLMMSPTAHAGPAHDGEVDFGGGDRNGGHDGGTDRHTDVHAVLTVMFVTCYDEEAVRQCRA